MSTTLNPAVTSVAPVRVVEPEVTEASETKVCLEKARALVEQGWCQLAKYRITPEGGDSYCMMGAISAIYIDIRVKVRATRALASVVGTNAVWEWNDVKGRDKQQVLNAFDEAIMLVHNGEV